MRRFVIFGAVILAVILTWTAGWFYFAGLVRTQIAALGEGDGVAEPKVTCGTLNVGGYPFRFNVSCIDASITSGDVTGTFGELRASVLVYQPTHAEVLAMAPLTLTDAFTGSRSTLDWATLSGSVRIDNWRIGRISVVGEGLSWTNALANDALIANAGHVEAHLLDIPERHDAGAGLAALAGYAKIAGLTAPGAEITAGDSELEFELNNVPDDVRAIGEDILRRWQAAGGNLKLVGLRGSDQDNSFEVTGDVRLDTAGRPEGTVDITSHGLVERIEAMVPEGLRGAVLGAPQDDGSYRQTLMLTNGVVFSGLLPVGAVPPLF